MLLERRALIARRLPRFAIGWMCTVLVWLGVFACEGRLVPAAVGAAAVTAAALAVAIAVTRADPVAPRVVPLVVATSIGIGLAAIRLVLAVGAYGEVLAFLLLTLYLLTALLFAWGWRAELTLMLATLAAWVVRFPELRLFVPLPELCAAVAIGAGLALGVAEASAQYVQQVHRRRRAQRDAIAALQASRDAYRNLAEKAPDLIWSADPDGIVTYVNESLARFLGLPSEEIVGHSFRELVNFPDNPDLDAIYARLGAGEIVPPTTMKYPTPAGPRWVEVAASPIVDEHGAVVGVRGVSRDVEERKRAEAALRESEERFRSAFDDAAIGMALTTVDGRTIRVNPALCAMLGYSQAELLALRPEQVVHRDDFGPMQLDRAGLGAGAAPFYRAERRYLHRDGHVLWVQVTASMVRDATGAALYYVGQIQDITERHVAEEALRDSIVELRHSEARLRRLAQHQVVIREEERKRLGFDLHDDVCQELVGVGILVESLRRKLAPIPADHAAEFERVVRYLGEVVEHLRLLARELRPLLLRDLGLDGSLRALADGLSSPTLHIATEMRTPVPRLDEETEVAVYRIAQEALANAVRHAGAETVVLALGASERTLTLEIRDDGHGFDPAVRPAVALGCASMEERALALGGRLEIRSTPGAGTVVELTCPLAADGVRTSAARSPTRSSSRLSGATTPRSAAPD